VAGRNPRPRQAVAHRPSAADRVGNLILPRAAGATKKTTKTKTKKNTQEWRPKTHHLARIIAGSTRDPLTPASMRCWPQVTSCRAEEKQHKKNKKNTVGGHSATQKDAAYAISPIALTAAFN